MIRVLELLALLTCRTACELRVLKRLAAVRRDPRHLVVTKRALDGALTLKLPLRTHRCAERHVDATAAAAAAAAAAATQLERGGESGGVRRSEWALLPRRVARLLLHWVGHAWGRG